MPRGWLSPEQERRIAMNKARLKGGYAQLGDVKAGGDVVWSDDGLRFGRPTPCTEQEMADYDKLFPEYDFPDEATRVGENQ